MKTKKVSRRDFLRMGSFAAVGAVLASCQTGKVEDTVRETVKETVIVEGTPQTVEKIVERIVTATSLPAEIPEIHFYSTALGCGLEGSNPERLVAVQNKIFDALGVKVNAYLAPPGGARLEKLNTLLASASQPLDLFVGKWPDYKGVVLPWNDLLDDYGQDIVRMHTLEDIRAEVDLPMMQDSEGTYWGYPRDGIEAATHQWYFRTDWLEEVGMDMPTNWDEMEEVIAAFKQAHPESVVATNTRWDLMMNTLGAFTEYGYSNWIDSDGMLKPPELQPGYKDWVVKMNDWWEKGWLHKESFADMDVRAVLKTLTIGVWLGWVSRIPIWWEDIRKAAGYEKEDYDCPLGPTGPKGLAKTIYRPTGDAYMIPRKSKYPEAVVRYINWHFEDMPEDFTNWLTTRIGVEGTDWEWKEELERYTILIAECGDKYAGELQVAQGPVTNAHRPLLMTEEEGGFHSGRWEEYLVSRSGDWEYGKMPVDMNVPYDDSLIRDKFPGLNDFNRILEEESIKFISGVRSLTEWDDYMAQIETAGLQQWSELYTAEYRKYYPAD